ncbi:MAG: asparagine synthetase B, partial [Thermoanaerobaculia bacterium]
MAGAARARALRPAAGRGRGRRPRAARGPGRRAWDRRGGPLRRWRGRRHARRALPARGAVRDAVARRGLRPRLPRGDGGGAALPGAHPHRAGRDRGGRRDRPAGAARRPPGAGRGARRPALRSGARTTPGRGRTRALGARVHVRGVRAAAAPGARATDRRRGGLIVCGIAGLLRLTGDAPLPLGELRRTSAALARRGPDGEGEWSSPSHRAALAHRRLAVIDLSAAAAQPMLSRDGARCLAYNGEIYNYRALASELVAAGVELRTSSDTEIVLEILTREGAGGLSRLRGMYALALWNEESGELLLARDPYGIKPLYYAVEGGVLRFASQVRALEAGGGLASDVDPAGVAGFLAWGAVPEPWTFRRAVRALPAGHVLTASAARGVRVEPAPWVLDGARARDVETALARGVSAHLTADVPVAVFLSAGLDSALVAALARRAADAES